MAFDSKLLLRKLAELTAEFRVGRWVVAYSGGIDSTVMLHALATSTTETSITAVHVNHGLHPESDLWAAHCERIAAELTVEFVSFRVNVPSDERQGPEAAARTARYAVLREMVNDHDCLLSAHHTGDQAETLLLNLMRGSGVDGLAGIGMRQPFGSGLLLRPMLHVPTESIDDYAKKHELDWVEDPSNADTRYDRNFLRQQVVPLLQSRWPAAVDRVQRSAHLVGEASTLLSDLAQIDLTSVGTPDRLNSIALQNLSAPRQRNLLRHAIRLCGLPLPPATKLQQIIDVLIPAREDAQPLVSWAGAEVRRFRDRVFILAPLPACAATGSQCLTPDGPPIRLGTGLGSVRLEPTQKLGISPALAKGGLQVQFRSGGEEMRVTGRSSTRKLKTLFQENAVLPWMRSRLPFLYADGQLVAVADLWIDDACKDEPGYVIQWDERPTLN